MEQRIVYHFVWGPMRHKACLTGEAARRLRELIEEKASDLQVELEDLAVFPDRVYVAVAAPPILSPHRIVCQFKAHSSRCLRHEFQEMTRIPTVWTRAYLVRAGEQVTPEQVLAAFEAAMPPRRRPGRPRSCDRRE
ncbi:MAG TPA: IS200/IS605 family transposase [Chloroflexota bacterium]|nr:IS200/IS605 family transposase [Chloroflexota bacterium]